MYVIFEELQLFVTFYSITVNFSHRYDLELIEFSLDRGVDSFQAVSMLIHNVCKRKMGPNLFILFVSNAITNDEYILLCSKLALSFP